MPLKDLFPLGHRELCLCDKSTGPCSALPRPSCLQLRRTCVPRDVLHGRPAWGVAGTSRPFRGPEGVCIGRDPALESGNNFSMPLAPPKPPHPTPLPSRLSRDTCAQSNARACRQAGPAVERRGRTRGSPSQRPSPNFSSPRARAGYTHTAFSFANESLVTKANINGADVPPGSLISFVQKVKNPCRPLPSQSDSCLPPRGPRFPRTPPLAPPAPHPLSNFYHVPVYSGHAFLLGPEFLREICHQGHASSATAPPSASPPPQYPCSRPRLHTTGDDVRRDRAAHQ